MKQPKRTRSVAAAAWILLGLASWIGSLPGEGPKPHPASSGPERLRIGPGVAPRPAPPGFRSAAVPAQVRRGVARHIVRSVPAGPLRLELPEPKKRRPPTRSLKGGDPVPRGAVGAPAAPLVPPLETSFDAGDFDTNPALNGGFLFIPPDPIGAAGPEHLVNVVNTYLQAWEKDGTLDFELSLADFFGALGPDGFPFDPKVIYDQYQDRWVVVALEFEDTTFGDPVNDSRLLLAVSDDWDPNGTWFEVAIDAVTDIGGTDHWADYPGFAVDEEAVYVTANMFEFFSFGGTFGGNRLWAIEKGAGSGGFYDGAGAAVTVLDPYGPSCLTSEPFCSTTQPAHMFGAAPAGVGTFLVLFSGLTDGMAEFLQITRLDDPLGSPSFDSQFVDFGNVSDSSFPPMPDAPQSGTGVLIETNDLRTLDAAWRADSLFVSTTVNPNPGHSEDNEATAYWVQVDTSDLGALALGGGDFVTGEDIAANTHTFMAAISVNSDRNAAVGFADSASSIFASAHFTTLDLAAGSDTGSEVLRDGLDFYIRDYGSGRNRWGDYTGMEVDPADQCFWVFNEYAITRGTPDGSGDDGRWGTAFGKFCPFPVLFAEGFLGGPGVPPGWTVERGTAEVDGFSLNGTPDTDPGFDQQKFRAVANAGAFDGCDLCIVEARVFSTNPLPDAIPATLNARLLTHFFSKQSNFAVTIKPDQDKVVVRQKEGTVTLVRDDIDVPGLALDTWYSLRVVFDGVAFDVFLDDRLLVRQDSEFADPGLPAGTVGFQSRDSDMKIDLVAARDPSP